MVPISLRSLTGTCWVSETIGTFVGPGSLALRTEGHPTVCSERAEPWRTLCVAAMCMNAVAACMSFLLAAAFYCF
jgi:hypothetical protein